MIAGLIETDFTHQMHIDSASVLGARHRVTSHLCSLTIGGVNDLSISLSSYVCMSVCTSVRVCGDASCPPHHGLIVGQPLDVLGLTGSELPFILIDRRPEKDHKAMGNVVPCTRTAASW